MNKSKLFLPIFLFLPLALVPGCNKEKITEKITQEKEVTDQESNGQTGGEENITGSITKLLGLNKSIKCTWDNSSGEDKIKGDIYISGNNYYQEVTFPDNGKFYSVNDSEYLYSWNSRVPGGTKFKFEKTETENTGEGVKETVENNNYKCVPWAIDASKFVVPSNIEFTDTTEEMNKLQEQATSDEQTGQDLCQSCDVLTDEPLKAKCRTNMGCE